MALASVRTATPDDVPQIAEIQVGTWRAAYADLLPAAVLADLDEQEAGQVWAAALKHDERHHVLVAVEGERTVGFCAVGPAGAEDTARADGSQPTDASVTGVVSALLVAPRWGRRGHGGRLLAEAASRLRAQGSTRGLAWVPETDAVSAAFYARAGWEPDGTVRTLDAGGAPLRELRFTGSLDLATRET